MYSLVPTTSKTLPRGSSTILLLPCVRTSKAAVTRRLGSSLRTSSASVVRKTVRAGVLGVSFETDQKITEALSLSRRIISDNRCADNAPGEHSCRRVHGPNRGESRRPVRCRRDRCDRELRRGY